MYFLFSCRHHVSGSHKTNMNSIHYMPNDGPLLDKPKHIGMTHSIHITHRYSILVGTDTVLLQLLIPSLVLFH